LAAICGKSIVKLAVAGWPLSKYKEVERPENFAHKHVMNLLYNI
jgi:hypothetical protein